MDKNESLAWNKVAKWYDSLVGETGSEYHQNVIFPSLIKSLGDKKIAGKTVIDLACGQGVLCRQLSNLGAKVTGIDIAPALVRMAKKRKLNNDNEPSYITADVTKLLSQNGNLKLDLKSEYYDYATVVLAIQNINPLSPLFKAVSKLLKKGGSLIIVMMHPCFRIPQYSNWQFNDEKHRQERIMWKYLNSETIEILSKPSNKANSEITYHYHRPINAYINSASKYGLYLEEIQELASNKKEQKGIKSEAIELAKSEIPMFLSMKFTKL